jgi:hypothetical protein
VVDSTVGQQLLRLGGIPALVQICGDGYRIGESLDGRRRQQYGPNPRSSGAGDVPARIVSDEDGLSGAYVQKTQGLLKWRGLRLAIPDVRAEHRKHRSMNRGEQAVGCEL